MNKMIPLVVSALIVSTVFPVMADENRPEHFKGKTSASWSEAMNNLDAANAQLQDVLKKEDMSLADSAKIHELSYTMENALQQMRAQIVEIEETLEQLHLASESPDLDRTQQLGNKYLRLVDHIGK